MINSQRHDVRDPIRIRPAAKRQDRIPFNGVLTNKILSNLPGADVAHILTFLEPVAFSSGECIYELDQEISFVYFPETLVISQLCYLKDGSATGVSIVGRDGLLGLSAILDNKRAQYWAIATIGGTALRIRTDELKREFLHRSSLQKLVLTYANERLLQLAQRTVCNSRHRLEERLCSWLLMIQDRTNSPDLPLTHEVISQQLGTRRAGVTNFCNVLRDNGVISYHRALMTVLDRPALENVACECYRKG